MSLSPPFSQQPVKYFFSFFPRKDHARVRGLHPFFPPMCANCIFLFDLLCDNVGVHRISLRCFLSLSLVIFFPFGSFPFIVFLSSVPFSETNSPSIQPSPLFFAPCLLSSAFFATFPRNRRKRAPPAGCRLLRPPMHSHSFHLTFNTDFFFVFVWFVVFALL